MYSTYTAIDAHYRDFVLNIRIYFNQIETLLWDRRNKIKILPFEDEEIVVKSFKIPHIFNRIVYSFFRASKAKKWVSQPGPFRLFYRGGPLHGLLST